MRLASTSALLRRKYHQRVVAANPPRLRLQQISCQLPGLHLVASDFLRFCYFSCTCHCIFPIAPWRTSGKLATQMRSLGSSTARIESLSDKRYAPYVLDTTFLIEWSEFFLTRARNCAEADSSKKETWLRGWLQGWCGDVHINRKPQPMRPPTALSSCCPSTPLILARPINRLQSNCLSRDR